MNKQFDLEKDQLLDEVLPLFTKVDDFDIKYLIATYLFILFVLLILFPKIYFQNKIYYESRDIAVLKREYKTLQEENELIKMKVEKMRFKNQVLDTMFADEE